MGTENSPRISPAALVEVETAFHEYTQAVLNSGLKLGTQRSYIDPADCFIRWLKHEFMPGERIAEQNFRSDREKQAREKSQE